MQVFSGANFPRIISACGAYMPASALSPVVQGTAKMLEAETLCIVYVLLGLLNYLGHRANGLDGVFAQPGLARYVAGHFSRTGGSGIAPRSVPGLPCGSRSGHICAASGDNAWKISPGKHLHLQGFSGVLLGWAVCFPARSVFAEILSTSKQGDFGTICPKVRFSERRNYAKIL